MATRSPQSQAKRACERTVDEHRDRKRQKKVEIAAQPAVEVTPGASATATKVAA